MYHRPEPPVPDGYFLPTALAMAIGDLAYIATLLVEGFLVGGVVLGLLAQEFGALFGGGARIRDPVIHGRVRRFGARRNFVRAGGSCAARSGDGGAAGQLFLAHCYYCLSSTHFNWLSWRAL